MAQRRKSATPDPAERSAPTRPARELLVSVLGPVRLEVGDAVVDVPGTKRRAVLALLAMAAPEPITTDRLVDAIWPGEAPRSGRSALQSHVSRLRRHLEEHGDRLENAGHGYRLVLEPDELDAWVAARLVDDARHAAPDDSATARLRAARGLWRGRPLSDVDEVTDLAVRGRTRRLERARPFGLLLAVAEGGQRILRHPG
jgi:DNA-binding SARP family transcriptional activator